MDEFKHRAGEKFEALHEAAITAADTGKSRVQDVLHQTIEAIGKIRQAFRELWHNEFVAEGRERVVAWSRDAVQRIKDGAPPLSPLVLYEDLLELFRDRVWRRSVIIFACGVLVGGGTGLAVGARLAGRSPSGPHARALHTHPDQTVILVEDAISPGAGTGEVLIRVQAFSICGIDRGTLRGRGHVLRSLLSKGQVTVGRGFAGVVLDVGHGVTELELGDEVWGCVTEWSGGAGTELLITSSTRVSKRPRSVSADSAAALPWAGTEALIALSALRYSRDNVKGKRVAICGASSGEGTSLVQLLSGWGAHVTVVAPRHAALTLQDLGAHEYVDGGSAGEWAALEQKALRNGPWDAVVACPAADTPRGTKPNVAALLKATAPRRAFVDLRPNPLVSDRLPTPLSILFAASFYSYRLLRWVIGLGTHTDWLEEPCRLRDGLDTLAKLVESGDLSPILDKFGARTRTVVRTDANPSRYNKVCVRLPALLAEKIASKERSLQDTPVSSAHEYVDGGSAGEWAALEQKALRNGPWDAVVACPAADTPRGTKPNVAALLKATAPRRAFVDLRPNPLVSDRLPTPLSILFAASFYSYRLLRWVIGLGTHTDWLEEPCRLRDGLDTLAKLVESGDLSPILDKVYLPQDFESALAHACSEDAIGTTVIRFP